MWVGVGMTSNGDQDWITVVFALVFLFWPIGAYLLTMVRPRKSRRGFGALPGWVLRSRLQSHLRNVKKSQERLLARSE